ncbi:polymorphic toxin-type HINT domain-containing protein [Cytophagaceae bacterium YF14B1]|uniref:Polymorphic toxin-type HINT domain-containing protein n=1 Tax=Xanthocytophaga flava TaxID=3048013 RepID=A0AAE3QTI2_9BACT|nr:polymorphic toxin-type HINT domain-containing protein [Xanthocytophaga flavus]MDJ1482966.1 polymorphic toxin-type HINT domain-containing protein [Xanthocytophaga flavus]
MQVGEKVLAQRVSSGETGLQKIVSISRNQVSRLVRILAGKDTIWSTVTHPFVGADGKTISAGNLRKGIWLRKAVASVMLASSSVFVPEAQAVAVDSVAIVDTSATVYNLKVEQFDAYLVGQEGMVVKVPCKIQAQVLALGITPADFPTSQMYDDFLIDATHLDLSIFHKTHLDAWKVLYESGSPNLRKNSEIVQKMKSALETKNRPANLSNKDIATAIGSSSSKEKMIDNLIKATDEDAYKKALSDVSARAQLAAYLKAAFPKGSKAVAAAEAINQNFKKILKERKLSEGIDDLAEGVSDLGDMYKSQFKDFLTKLRSPEYAAFHPRYQDELITKYFPADWLTRSDVDELTKEIFEKMGTWKNFFDGMGYQVHHIFPVNLFKNSNGFKIYYEFFAGKTLDFNAVENLRNALMLQGKKVEAGKAIGVEDFVLGVHTNHDYYETAIGAYMDLKADSYIKGLKISGVETVDDLFKKVTDATELQDKLSKVANLLDDDVNEIATKLKPLLIQKSIKGNGNKILDVNDVLIKNEANPEQSIIDLLTN